MPDRFEVLNICISDYSFFSLSTKISPLYFFLYFPNFLKYFTFIKKAILNTHICTAHIHPTKVFWSELLRTLPWKIGMWQNIFSESSTFICHGSFRIPLCSLHLLRQDSWSIVLIMCHNPITVHSEPWWVQRKRKGSFWSFWDKGAAESPTELPDSGCSPALEDCDVAGQRALA